MAEASGPVVLFDVVGTLGAATMLATGSLETLAIYSYIPGLLRELHDGGVELGIIAESPDDAQRVLSALVASGLRELFQPGLLINRSGVAPGALFRLAAERAGIASTPERCVYISQDSRERRAALDAGFKVGPHPSFAWDVLNGGHVRYLRVTVPPGHGDVAWRAALRELPLVPLQATGEGGTIVYAIGTGEAAARLDDLGFNVERLGQVDDPLATDLYLLRDDRQVRTGFLQPEGQSTPYFAGPEESTWVIASAPDGLYVALPANRSIEEYHFPEAQHGHTLKLVPDVSLLSPFGVDPNARPAPWLFAPAMEPALSGDEVATLRTLTADEIRAYLDRYTRVQPIDAETGRIIQSRHIASPDNAVATSALVMDLERIGASDFRVRRHRFTHEGRALDNVEAELVGQDSDELVLVTAHLDSTAAFSDGPYDAERDPAPGADDDGSGMVGVLAAARVIKQLAGGRRPKRTIRFVLFNAEEHGLIGSKAYARDQAALDAPIIAVYQMDMIGYNVNPPRTFEVHAGFGPSPDVERRSRLLAERIGRLTKEVATGLESPQIYISPDPAAGRSDHASFQERGYAACAISEDFFVGPGPDSPSPETNPNYHKDSDTIVDAAYAADLARVVAAAAWLTANA